METHWFSMTETPLVELTQGGQFVAAPFSPVEQSCTYFNSPEYKLTGRVSGLNTRHSASRQAGLVLGAGHWTAGSSSALASLAACWTSQRVTAQSP